MTPPVLQTERLTLRLPEARDFPTYRAFYDAATGDSADYGGPRSEKEAWRKLAADIGHWHLRGYGMFSIVRCDDAAVLGGCGLCWPEGWPSHELTWWLLGEGRGAGYATEASRAVIGWAYADLGWSRVETHMRDENGAARRLAERLGGSVDRRETFPDGRTRDVFVLPEPASEKEAAA